jgi:hypothetical protein
MKIANLEVGNLNRRALLGLAVIVIIVLRFGIFADDEDAVVAPAESVSAAELRLERLRRQASMLEGKEAELKRALEQLAAREKGMVTAETAAQAQAQLLETVHKVAQQEGIDARGAEQLRVRPLADDYGEVSVTMSFTCTIEQLVNFLAALGNEPQLLATSDIRITPANAKQKTIGVRLGVSGVVPRKLVPEKKGVGSF